VLGVEAAANVAAIAWEAGIPTWNRFFDLDCAREIRRELGPAKIVTAAGVFFHLEDLHGVTEGIAELLADDGVFVVQAIYLGGILANTAFDQIYHEHLCYYTLRSLSAQLERHGLEVFDVSLLPIHGGSIEARAARKGTRPIAPSVAALAAEEAVRGLGEIETYHRFARDVETLRGKMMKLLTRYREAGQSVWAYGAPAKGATLLNSFAIGTELVQQAVERNPLKVGLAIPGVRVPIVAEDPAVWPDAYLVLSWNFLDEFLRNPANQAFLQAGGAFIAPAPRVHIIDRSGVHDV
jgi:hypothetical protein